jgi:hypothetical protein
MSGGRFLMSRHCPVLRTELKERKKGFWSTASPSTYLLRYLQTLVACDSSKCFLEIAACVSLEGCPDHNRKVG